MSDFAPCPSQQEFPQHGLVSLWDMLHFKGYVFVHLIQQLSQHRSMLEGKLTEFASPEHKNISVKEMFPEKMDAFVKPMQEVERQAFELEAFETALAAGEYVAMLKNGLKIHEMGGCVREIENSLRRNLSLREMFLIDPTKAPYFKGVWRGCQEAIDKHFPEAGYDFQEAGKCLAFERPKACVMHTMVALENPVKMVARHVVDLNLDKPSMGSYLKAFRDFVDEKNVGKTGNGFGNDKEEKVRLNELHSHANAVKNAYRDPTLHNLQVREKFTDGEAKLIYENAMAFVVLASKMLPSKSTA